MLPRPIKSMLHSLSEIRKDRTVGPVVAAAGVGDPQHRLLQLKLIEAGGTPPHTEDRT